MSTETKLAAPWKNLSEMFPGLTIKSCFHMGQAAFETGTQAVYGTSIELLESSNDTTHEYRNVDGEVESWDESDLEEAIQSGGIECYKAGVVLNDLVRRGVLPAGDYFIRVCW